MEAARGGFKDIVEELAKRGPNCDLNMRTVRTLGFPQAHSQIFNIAHAYWEGACNELIGPPTQVVPLDHLYHHK